MSALDLWFISLEKKPFRRMLTLVSMTLGHTDDVDHLVLGKHLADGHLLLEVLTGKVDLDVINKVRFRIT